ncbi:MAG: adenine deaminase [Vallitaleaceae bacterium]|nr:adenine deaminase [Vallitaleaceae bacterium]
MDHRVALEKQIRFVRVARGLEKADLVIKNCNYVNVFTGKIDYGDIGICDGYIIGVGNYEGEEEIDLAGRYLCPGLIDGHVHIESSMLTPSGFACAVLPHGTTTVIADPHEIANVCGVAGIEYMLAASKASGIDVHLMLPSCVPSTDFENAGAILSVEDLVPLMNREGVLGLGEMMNYPGVLSGNEGVHQKLLAFQNKRIDGHAPSVSGLDLNAYILSGIKTDHECTSSKELMEKVSKGMYVLLREGSATRNVRDLIKGVNKYTSRYLLFCTDDKHPSDIKKEGHINYNIKIALEQDVDFITAIQMATINVANCYGLRDKGAIAPGYKADFIVFDDPKSFRIQEVYKEGRLVVKKGEVLISQEAIRDTRVLQTVKLPDIKLESLEIPLKSDYVKVIGINSDSLITTKCIRKIDRQDGRFVSNPKMDILKLIVVERHKRTGNIGKGLVEGYGLKNGAIGVTVAHDSHNLLVIGDSDRDMLIAIEELNRIQGGLVVVEKGRVIGSLALEVGGLMTDAPLDEVVKKLEVLESVARRMGVAKGVDPFVTLAFMALPVIPDLKLTDCGLFDVNLFSFVELEE